MEIIVKYCQISTAKTNPISTSHSKVNEDSEKPASIFIIQPA